MRGTLALLVFGVVFLSTYNAINLILIGTTGMLIWAIVFAVAAPIVGLVQALYSARLEAGPIKFRPSSLILSGLILTQAAMMPLAENIRERAQECAPTINEGC